MIDTHTHLYLKQFKDDIEDVISRAKNIGVHKFYLPSISSKYNKSMHYLEKKFPNPSLIPNDQENKVELDKILEFTRSGHFPIIKTWAYGRNNKPTKTPESMVKFEKLQKDRSIVEFHKETLCEGGISEDKILAAEKILKEMFTDLDNRLAKYEWILGDKMTIADIAWIPQYALFQRNDFPFELYPNFIAYVARWQKRPAYITAIGNHMPGSMDLPYTQRTNGPI